MSMVLDPALRWRRNLEEVLITTLCKGTPKDSPRKTTSKLNMYLMIITISIMNLQFTGQMFVLVGHWEEHSMRRREKAGCMKDPISMEVEVDLLQDQLQKDKFTKEYLIFQASLNN